jgi:hypothetical protein
MRGGSDEVGRLPRCACAWLLALALSFAATGCAGKRAVPDLHQASQQVEGYIDSGRYAAACAAVAAKAREYLDHRAPQVKKPAAPVYFLP